MLFAGKHEDGDDEEGGEEHLEEKTLWDGCSVLKDGVDVHGARQDGGYDSGGTNAGKDLSWEEQCATDGGKGTADDHSKSNLRFVNKMFWDISV